MRGAIGRIVESPLGAVVYKLAGPAVRYGRRILNGGLPNHYKIIKAEYKGRSASIRVRRWSGCDLSAIRQCFLEAQYDLPNGAHGEAVERLYRTIAASGRQPLIVDCGANIGASVMWFAMRYPEAHIVAIEPEPDNLALLRMNTAGLDAEVWAAGIADVDGKAFLMNRNGNVEMTWEVSSEPSDLPVDLVSVKTLLEAKPEERYAPFLLKLDIEGGEKALFCDDTSAIQRFPVIIMEPHDWQHPGKGTSLGFFRFHVQAGREFAMKHENVASLALTL